MAQVLGNTDHFPSVDQITALQDVHADVIKLRKSIQEDLDFSACKTLQEKVERYEQLLPKYIGLAADYEYLEAMADSRLKFIKGSIIVAFEDNPKAFLLAGGRKNALSTEGVYRTHAQYKEALKAANIIVAQRKAVQQALYALVASIG